MTVDRVAISVDTLSPVGSRFGFKSSMDKVAVLTPEGECAIGREVDSSGGIVRLGMSLEIG